jgi:hypothetical protein
VRIGTAWSASGTRIGTATTTRTCRRLRLYRGAGYEQTHAVEQDEKVTLVYLERDAPQW